MPFIWRVYPHTTDDNVCFSLIIILAWCSLWVKHRNTHTHSHTAGCCQQAVFCWKVTDRNFFYITDHDDSNNTPYFFERVPLSVNLRCIFGPLELLSELLGLLYYAVSYHKCLHPETNMKAKCVCGEGPGGNSWSTKCWLIISNNLLCKLNWLNVGPCLRAVALHVVITCMWKGHHLNFSAGTLCERAHMSSPYVVTFGVVTHGNCRTAMQTWQSCHNVMHEGARTGKNIHLDNAWHTL